MTKRRRSLMTYISEKQPKRKLKKMQNEQIAETIWQIINEWLEPQNRQINYKTDINLIDELGMDSVAIVQTILQIEKDFNIVIGQDELNGELLARFSNLIELVRKKINETN